MSEQYDGGSGVDIACRVCKYALNYFRGPGGGMYVHGRPELDYDHDPQPIEKDKLDKVKFICDFCRAEEPTWNVHAEAIKGLRDPNGMPRNYTPDWAACAPCARLVQRRDMEGLIDRVYRAQCRDHKVPAHIANSRAFKEAEAAGWREQYSTLFPLIKHVRPLVREPMSMDDIPPSKLPKVRDRLAKLWGDPKLADGYVDQQSRGGIYLPGVDAGDEGVFAVNVGVPDAGPHKFCRRMEAATQVADLYWISSAFTRLAMGAGSKLTDMTISRDQMPSAHGLLVWESPVATITGVINPEADVFGVGWTLVPGGMWLVAYVRAEEFFVGRYDTLQGLRETTGWFFPASCGAGIPFDVPARAEQTDSDIDPRYRTGGAFDLIGTVFATWHLMRQGGIAEETREQPDKATRKAYGRAGRRIPEVRVVNLRKRARASRTPSDAPQSRAGWSYRVTVGLDTGGFWRTYWTGPGRAVKEQRFIEPYLTGTDDMPMKEDLDVQIVKTLR